jgi:uncharacterized protein YjbI with pentapeptide repeats
MANQEQLDILKQGGDIWNAWRNEHPDEYIDLSGIDLHGIDLHRTNLGRVNFNYANLREAKLYDAYLMAALLIEADLRMANLSGTNLVGANLNRAKLNEASLIRADLRGANLIEADFSRADLSVANISDARLEKANFREAKLKGAILGTSFDHHINLSYAIIGQTVFEDIDLRHIEGLDTIHHDSRSYISTRALERSQGDISESFLRGAGLSDTFIEYARSLASHPIEYYSCFISYSSKDEDFAKRLYADLQSHGVRCWFAPEDLKWGERIRTGIDEAIYMHDKLLLILSKHSVSSGWVEREVKTALSREKKEKRTVLFPVRVDGAVFDSPFDWATEIRHERNIGDFTRWNQHDDYQTAFDRLLRDLKADAQKTGSRDVRTKDS